MKKVTYFSFILLLFTALVLSACQSGEVQEGEVEGKKEEKQASQENTAVIMGIKSPLITLDPANHRDRVTESVLRNIYDGLVTKDAVGEIQPKIAESWENPSPTEWIFTIRQDVTFHDGSQLTTDDVAFTFNRIIKEGAMGGETSPRGGLLGPLAEVEAIDETTVKFTFSSPWPIFLKMLPHQQIVSEKYMEAVGEEEFLKNPIGAGPYKVVEAKLDERIVLEGFADYYDGAPEIGNLVFDVIPETSSRVAALQTGEVHRIHALSPSLAEQLKNDPNIVVKDTNSTRVNMIEMNTQVAPFDKVEVRKAMNHAINIDKIISSMFGEYAIRLPGAMLPNSFGLNTDLEPYAYDQEKAKALLAEAGYGDGFSLIIDTIDEHKEVAEAIANDLRAINIDAKTRVWDPGVLKEMLLNGERQMSVMDWGNSTLDPYDLLDPKFKTDDRGNYSRYSNPKVDELLSLGEIELDEEKRSDIYKEAQQIIYDDAPWVFGYSVKEIEAGVKNLESWEPFSDGMLYMPNIKLTK